MAQNQTQKKIKIDWGKEVNTQVPIDQNNPVQMQIYEDQQLQLQQHQLQYYLYEDLVNFLGIQVEVLETIKYFKNNQNHEYVTIAKNRLISQRNLSYAIHRDCSERFKDYKTEKVEVFKIFQEIIKRKINTSYVNDLDVQDCVNDYLKLKDDQPQIEFFKPLIYTDRNSNFNIGVVQKVFEGMQQVEQQLEQVKKGIYKTLDTKEIDKILDERKNRAQNLLKLNFKIAEQDGKFNSPNFNQNKNLTQKNEVQSKISPQKNDINQQIITVIIK